jgi:hypothetical protein
MVNKCCCLINLSFETPEYLHQAGQLKAFVTDPILKENKHSDENKKFD